jgi:sulfonate transport system permease protein
MAGRGAPDWLSSRILPEPLAGGESVLATWPCPASCGRICASACGARPPASASAPAVGLLLGLLNGSSRRAATLLDTTVQMMRNIPALALIPLVILWFGIDEAAKLFLLSVGVFFPVYLNTFHGIRSVDAGPDRDGAQLRPVGLGPVPRRDPAGALPSILVGVRFSLGLVWVLLIVAETISAQAGIGYMTMNAREFLQTDVVLVGVLLYALLGKAADLAARGLERRFLRWNPAYR